MTYLITGRCVVDTACVDVCPVDAIGPTPERADFALADQLYIDPEACVDCNACAEACPVDAVVVEATMSADLRAYVAINADFFRTRSA